MQPGVFRAAAPPPGVQSGAAQYVPGMPVRTTSSFPTTSLPTTAGARVAMPGTSTGFMRAPAPQARAKSPVRVSSVLPQGAQVAPGSAQRVAGVSMAAPNVASAPSSTVFTRSPSVASPMGSTVTSRPVATAAPRMMTAPASAAPAVAGLAGTAPAAKARVASSQPGSVSMGPQTVGALGGASLAAPVCGAGLIGGMGVSEVTMMMGPDGSMMMVESAPEVMMMGPGGMMVGGPGGMMIGGDVSMAGPPGMPPGMVGGGQLMPMQAVTPQQLRMDDLPFSSKGHKAMWSGIIDMVQKEVDGFLDSQKNAPSSQFRTPRIPMPNIPDRQIEMIFDSYDTTHFGFLDEDQLKALMRDMQCVTCLAMSQHKGEALQEARMELTMMMGPQLAHMMSGSISQAMDFELMMVKELSKQPVPDKDVKELVSELDADKDGVVSKSDFLKNAKKALFDPNPPEEVMQMMESMEAAMNSGMPMAIPMDGGMMVMEALPMGMMGGGPMALCDGIPTAMPVMGGPGGSFGMPGMECVMVVEAIGIGGPGMPGMPAMAGMPGASFAMPGMPPMAAMPGASFAMPGMPPMAAMPGASFAMPGMPASPVATSLPTAGMPAAGYPATATRVMSTGGPVGSARPATAVPVAAPVAAGMPPSMAFARAQAPQATYVAPAPQGAQPTRVVRI